MAGPGGGSQARQDRSVGRYDRSSTHTQLGKGTGESNGRRKRDNGSPAGRSRVRLISLTRRSRQTFLPGRSHGEERPGVRRTKSPLLAPPNGVGQAHSNFCEGAARYASPLARRVLMPA